MVALKKSVVIEAPAERVFAYVTEPTTMADWFPGGLKLGTLWGSARGNSTSGLTNT